MEKNGEYVRVTHPQNKEVNKLGSKDFIPSQPDFLMKKIINSFKNTRMQKVFFPDLLFYIVVMRVILANQVIIVKIRQRAGIDI